jgi:hypothetical protein
MKRRIDSKYEIEVLDTNGDNFSEFNQPLISIRNVYNGNEIPNDEPLFIFRAKDKLAFDTLTYYLHKCIEDGCSREQLKTLSEMCSEFRTWARNNPDKMKQPGSTMPEDMKRLSKGATEDLLDNRLG